MPLAATIDATALANRLRPVLLKLNRELRHEIHSLGVTGGQVSLLVQIKYHPGIGMRELAALERISVPGMSKFVSRLEEAGLVERAPVEGDQRRVGLTVTAAGHKVLRSVKSKRTAWLSARLVLSLTHSPVAVGILALCQFMPFTLFSLVAGVVVDRLDSWRTVIATQFTQMLLASTIAVVALAGVAQAWHVYVIAAMMGLVQVLDAPSRQSLR